MREEEPVLTAKFDHILASLDVDSLLKSKSEKGVQSFTYPLHNGELLKVQAITTSIGLTSVEFELSKKGIGIGELTATRNRDSWDIGHRETHPDFRRKGIFRGLNAFFEQLLKAHYINATRNQVTLHLSSGQLSVIKAFEAIGYTSSIPSSELVAKIEAGELSQDDNPDPYLSRQGETVRFELEKTLSLS